MRHGANDPQSKSDGEKKCQKANCFRANTNGIEHIMYFLVQ